MSSRRWPISSSCIDRRDLRHQDGVGRGLRRGGHDRRRCHGVSMPLTRMNTSRGAEAAGLDRVGDLLARLLLGVGRDRVLQIEDHAVGRQACAPSRGRGRSSPACRARCGADGWSCRRPFPVRATVASVAEAVPACAAMRVTDAADSWLAGRGRLPRRLDRGLRAARTATRRGCGSCRALPISLAAPEAPAIVAVDMPIGLPERTGPGGRGGGECVRPLLGARQSSVFSVPSRSRDLRASTTARPAAIALAHLRSAAQGVEAALQHRRRRSARWTKPCAPLPGAPARVFEVHPELAFWRLNGERALARTEEGQKPALRAGPRAAARLAGRGRASREAMVNAPPPEGRRAPTICSMRSPAPRSRGASTPAQRSRSPIRRRATRSDCRWRSGREYAVASALANLKSP